MLAASSVHPAVMTDQCYSIINHLCLLQVTDGVITDPFVLNWLDLLCFLLSGLPANGTIAAEVAFMFNEWYRPGSALEFPRGGSQAMVNALVRSVLIFYLPCVDRGKSASLLCMSLYFLMHFHNHAQDCAQA